MMRAESHAERDAPTRDERRELIRAGLHELWPSFFPIQPLLERTKRAEARLDRLEKIAAKRKAVK